MLLHSSARQIYCMWVDYLLEESTRRVQRVENANTKRKEKRRKAGFFESCKSARVFCAYFPHCLPHGQKDLRIFFILRKLSFFRGSLLIADLFIDHPEIVMIILHAEFLSNRFDLSGQQASFVLFDASLFL